MPGFHCILFYVDADLLINLLYFDGVNGREDVIAQLVAFKEYANYYFYLSPTDINSH